MAPNKTRQRRPQAERSAASTKAMLDAALELILEHGTDVSMMAIGQRSGFSHGLVLARFGSKVGLLEAVAKEAQRRFSDGVTAISSDLTGIAKLHSIIDVYFQPPSDDAKAFYVLLGESFGSDRPLNAAVSRADVAFRHYVDETLQQAQQQGQISDSLDTASTAALLVGMFRGVALQYFVNPAALDMETMRALAHDLVIHILEAGGDPR